MLLFVQMERLCNRFVVIIPHTAASLRAGVGRIAGELVDLRKPRYNTTGTY